MVYTIIVVVIHLLLYLEIKLPTEKEIIQTNLAHDVSVMVSIVYY
jgi:hypothetical protein